MSSVFDFECRTIEGNLTPLSEYKGKVLLIVNTASECGFTPQFEGLEKLYKRYKDKGLMILGFPCNQFGQQDPGSNEQIQNFCSLNYGVSFPMFAKIDVNGANATPLYKYLKGEAAGVMRTKRIKWNFTKFLVGRDGSVLKRYAPYTKPEAIERDVIRLLD